MADTVARLDRSLAAVPVAAVLFSAGLVASVWVLAALPIAAVALGLAEVGYGWRLRKRAASTFRTLATSAVVVGGVIAVVAAVLAAGRPIGHFGSTGHHTSTITTKTP